MRIQISPLAVYVYIYYMYNNIIYNSSVHKIIYIYIIRHIYKIYI
jgi:hypothetical protein